MQKTNLFGRQPSGSHCSLPFGRLLNKNVKEDNTLKTEAKKENFHSIANQLWSLVNDAAKKFHTIQLHQSELT